MSKEYFSEEIDYQAPAYDFLNFFMHKLRIAQDDGGKSFRQNFSEA